MDEEADIAMIDRLMAERDQLRDENARLREALTACVDEGGLYQLGMDVMRAPAFSGMERKLIDKAETMCERARAALEMGRVGK
jgi:hypothetical protein